MVTALLAFGTVVAIVVAAAMTASILSELVVDPARRSLSAQATHLIVLVCALLARVAMTFGHDRYAHRASATVIAELRARALDSLTDPARTSPRELLGRRDEASTVLLRGLDALTPYLSGYVPALILTVTVTPAVIGVIGVTDWPSALIIVLTIPLIPLFMILVGLMTRDRTERKLATMSRLTAQTLDLIAGLPTLRALGRARAQAGRVAELGAAHRRSTMSALRVAFLSGAILELLATLCVALVAVGIGVRLVHGDMSLYAGVLALVLAPEAYLPLRQVGSKFHDSADGLAAANEAFALIDPSSAASVPSSAASVPPSSVEVPPSVEVRGAQATSLETPHDDNVTSPGFEAPRPAARHTSTNGGNGPEDIRRGDGTTGTFSMRITGIGGTGVVTISQVIATAATLDGRSARTVDMTGLAQKGGAVVSDVKITPEPAEEAAKVAARTCDLYLVCDALVGTDPVNLTVTEAHRTTAVVSTTKMPTGAMVIDTKVGFPADAAVHSAIDEHVGRALYLDAVATSDALFGDEQFANMLLVGAAHETGALPVSAASIERAIALNGVAVDTNMQAFRRGRQSVADPDALAAALAIRVRHAETAPSTDAVRAVEAAGITDPAVGAVTRLRYDELAAYADSDYAREYLAVVARVDRSALGADVTEAVARHLYKLMAYKDEYEVARLTADPAFAATVAHTYGDDATTAVRLHPPTLRALGLRHKVGFGRWARPALTGLARMKRLRGTALDPFRYTEVRRTERELIGEYREVIGQVLAAWDDGRIGVDDRPAIIGLLSLPDMVRGYEHIKLDNVAQYRDTVRRTLADLIT